KTALPRQSSRGRAFLRSFDVQQGLGILGEVADDAVEHRHEGGGPLAQALVGAFFAQAAQAVYGALVEAEGVVVVALQRAAPGLSVRRVEAEQEVRRRSEVTGDGADGGGRGRRGRAALGLEVLA